LYRLQDDVDATKLDDLSVEAREDVGVFLRRTDKDGEKFLIRTDQEIIDRIFSCSAGTVSARSTPITTQPRVYAIQRSNFYATGSSCDLAPDVKTMKKLVNHNEISNDQLHEYSVYLRDIDEADLTVKDSKELVEELDNSPDISQFGGQYLEAQEARHFAFRTNEVEDIDVEVPTQGDTDVDLLVNYKSGNDIDKEYIETKNIISDKGLTTEKIVAQIQGANRKWKNLNTGNGEQKTLTISTIQQQNGFTKTELKKMVSDAQETVGSKADVIRIITPEGKRYDFAVDEL
jgi:hypothetical protein